MTIRVCIAAIIILSLGLSAPLQTAAMSLSVVEAGSFEYYQFPCTGYPDTLILIAWKVTDNTSTLNDFKLYLDDELIKLALFSERPSGTGKQFIVWDSIPGGCTTSTPQTSYDYHLLEILPGGSTLAHGPARRAPYHISPPDLTPTPTVHPTHTPPTQPPSPISPLLSGHSIVTVKDQRTTGATPATSFYTAALVIVVIIASCVYAGNKRRQRTDTDACGMRNVHDAH